MAARSAADRSRAACSAAAPVTVSSPARTSVNRSSGARASAWTVSPSGVAYELDGGGERWRYVDMCCPAR